MKSPQKIFSQIGADWNLLDWLELIGKTKTHGRRLNFTIVKKTKLNKDAQWSPHNKFHPDWSLLDWLELIGTELSPTNQLNWTEVGSIFTHNVFVIFVSNFCDVFATFWIPQPHGLDRPHILQVKIAWGIKKSLVILDFWENANFKQLIRVLRGSSFLTTAKK